MNAPPEPTATLDPSNVKSLDLGNEATIVSAMLNSNKYVGYVFTATSGQRLQYQTDDELCIWLYSPENQLLDTPELPVTGKYTLQIGLPKGSKSFNLTIGFQTEKIARTEKSSSPPSDFTSSNF